MNSPANPTGRVLPAGHLAKMVRWARERGAVLASDECYIDLGFEAPARSVLHPDVCDGSHQGLLAVYSLSKRSNLAGYRAGFVTGDPDLIGQLLEVRKHAGMIVPAPVQAAMTAALDDDAHAAAAAGPVRGPARPAAGRAAAGRLADRALRRPGCTCGRPGPATTAGARSPRWPGPGSWSPPATSTARRAPATSGSPSPPPTSGSAPPWRGLAASALRWHRAAPGPAAVYAHSCRPEPVSTGA